MKTNLRYKTQFLKIGKIAGIYYYHPNKRPSSRIVIYGIGAPLPPDEGKLSDAPVILSYDTDLFVFDYLGFGRSDGRFTPLNCIKSFIYLYQALTSGCIGKSYYEGVSLRLRYKEIHFMGRSWGGIYVLLLPRFEKNIQNICSIFPVTDWRRLGKDKNHPEETIEGFYKAMTKDGYKYLYRGILHPVWRRHFSGEDGLSPIDNVNYLQNSYVFLGHGKKDTNIYVGHSIDFYNRLIQTFPNNKHQYMLKIYPYDHSAKTSNLAVKDYFKWRGIPKIKTPTS